LWVNCSLWVSRLGQLSLPIPLGSINEWRSLNGRPGCIRLYGCRSKSVGEGLDCGLGCMPALSVLYSSMQLATLHKCYAFTFTFTISNSRIHSCTKFLQLHNVPQKTITNMSTPKSQTIGWHNIIMFMLATHPTIHYK